MEIIGFTGRMGSGKNAAAELLKGYLQAQGKTVRLMAYGDELKYSLQEIFSFSNEQLFGAAKNVVDARYGITPREAMQRFGTDFMRNIVPNFWIDALMSNITDDEESFSTDVILITDVRFPGEAKAIKDRGGKIVRIVGRVAKDSAGTAHVSETSMDGIEVNATVYNTANLISLGTYIAEAYNQMNAEGELEWI